MIGNRISNLRRAKGLTQKELAAIVGVSENYIVQIETNKKNPPVRMISRLAECLGVTIEKLL